MNRREMILSGWFLCAAPFVTGLAGAHHSFANFDMDKNVTYQGAVVEYRWGNPHTHVIVKVRPAASSHEPATNWDIEGGSVNIMSRQGWKRNSFKVGDNITVVGHPMKDGSKGASMFYAVLPDGSRLYHDIARPKDDPKEGK